MYVKTGRYKEREPGPVRKTGLVRRPSFKLSVSSVFSAYTVKKSFSSDAKKRAYQSPPPPQPTLLYTIKLVYTILLGLLSNHDLMQQHHELLHEFEM